VNRGFEGLFSLSMPLRMHLYSVSFLSFFSFRSFTHFHQKSPQAYALSRRGAEAIASKYVSTVNLDNTRTSRSGGLSHLTIDLRSAVNLAADYALFNALPPHVPALLSWRPWILEEPILAAKSALFPGAYYLCSYFILQLRRGFQALLFFVAFIFVSVEHRVWLYARHQVL